MKTERRSRSPVSLRISELICGFSDSPDGNSLLKIGKEAEESLRQSDDNILRMSEYQSEKLAEGLFRAGILTSRQNLYELEAEVSADFDGIRSAIENQGRLQFRALLVLYRICCLDSSELEQMGEVEGLRGLAYEARPRVIEATVDEDDSILFVGLEKLAGKEREVFERKSLVADSLARKGILTDSDVELLKGAESVDEFRGLPGYNQMLLYDLFEKIKKLKDKPLECFQAIQEVLYLGLAMGMRDWYEEERREIEFLF